MSKERDQNLGVPVGIEVYCSAKNVFYIENRSDDVFSEGHASMFLKDSRRNYLNSSRDFLRMIPALQGMEALLEKS
jgi:hypothetical protein